MGRILPIVILLVAFGGNSEGMVKNEQDETLMRVRLVLDAMSAKRYNSAAGSSLTLAMTPVIFWHGMGDTAHGSSEIERLALQRKYPGMAVFSVQIGNNALEDDLASYFVNVNHQISSVCKEILENELIKRHGSFNAVGFSQGGQFIRGLIERCNFRENGIKVKNFVSLGGQHQGVFGLPNCKGNPFCDHIRSLLTHAAYTPSVQEHIVQAEYWHDPYQEAEYRDRSIFIADINNERVINETYRSNLLALDHMILVKFEDDEMVVPRESSHFGFYAPGQAEQVIPLSESDLFRSDRLGLKRLQEAEKLRMISVPGKHLQYSMTWFIDQIASVYLNN